MSPFIYKRPALFRFTYRNGVRANIEQVCERLLPLDEYRIANPRFGEVIEGQPITPPPMTTTDVWDESGVLGIELLVSGWKFLIFGI